MPSFSFEGTAPVVHPDAWIAPTATLVGDIVIESGVSIWYGVVIRADMGRVVIHEGTNVQDNSVIHLRAGVCEIGRDVTIGHQCLVHGGTLEDQVLVGNGAIVLGDVHIGARSLVASGATVLPGTVVPTETLIMGSPAKRMTELTGEARRLIDNNAGRYQKLARRHAIGIERVDLQTGTMGSVALDDDSATAVVSG